MVTRFQNYIAGEWIDSISGESFENRNPSDIDKVLGVFPKSTKADVDLAVGSAQKAFEVWKNIPPPERGNILFEAGKIITARKKKLAKILSDENGKTLSSAMGDIQSGIDMAYYAAGEGRRLYGQTTQSGLKKRFAMTKRYPIGVIGIITSWNFPMAITCWKTFPALICGNAVVLKSEENTPETAVCFTEVMEEAGLPKGVLNLIHGLGQEVGEALTTHSRVAMVSFTGSSQVGRIVGTNTLGRLGKTSLELGGKNAVIVLQDGDLDLAVDGIISGAFSISGQRCTATSRVIIHKDVYDQCLEKLLERVAKQKIGPGSDDTSDITPLISKKQQDRVLGYIDRCKQNGARLITGGVSLKGGVYDKGYYIAPTLVDHVSIDMEIAQEEVFGPVLVLFKAESYEDAVCINNSTRYGLSASLFTQDVTKAFSFFDDVEAGVCYINGPTFGSEPHLPFGGVKESGLGFREAGWAAIEAFSEVKTLYIDYSSKIQNVQFEDNKG